MNGADRNYWDEKFKNLDEKVDDLKLTTTEIKDRMACEVHRERMKNLMAGQARIWWALGLVIVFLLGLCGTALTHMTGGQ